MNHKYNSIEMFCMNVFYEFKKNNGGSKLRSVVNTKTLKINYLLPIFLQAPLKYTITL